MLTDPAPITAADRAAHARARADARLLADAAAGTPEAELTDYWLKPKDWAGMEG